MNGINFALLTDQLRIVERFTRTAQDKLSYDATIEDPGTWARPWTMHVDYPLDPTYELFEYACHEANYGMADILKGALVLDAKRQQIRAGQGKLLNIGGESFTGKPDLTQDEVLRTTLAAYNSGLWAYYSLTKSNDPDARTTGRDYSADTLARAAVFAQLV